MNIDVNKVITLGNKEKYLVISHIVNNNKDFCVDFIKAWYGLPNNTFK